MKRQEEQHKCDVVGLIMPTRWLIECSVCGPVGRPQELKNDALAIAKRHEEIGGFERPSR